MVSTRSASKMEAQKEAPQDAQRVKEEDKCKAERSVELKEAVDTFDAGNTMEKTSPRPSTAQSVHLKKSTSSSIIARKKMLELEAERAKARIKMDLIDKQLEVDLAALDDETSNSSLPSVKNRSECNERVVERWLEDSLQEVKTQCVTHRDNLDDELCPAPQESNLHHVRAAGPPPPATGIAAESRPLPTAAGGTDDGTVHALASALKDLAAATAAGASTSNARMLNRMCTPRDLPSFSGDPLEWLQFKQAFEESSQVCNFSDKENLWRLRKSLHGPAREAVTALLIGATSAADVMTTLELQFGNPDVIISKILQEIHRLRPMSQEYHKDIIHFSVKVRNCVAAVSAIGCEDYLKGLNVVSAIISKLPIVLISKWTDYSYSRISDKQKPHLLMLSEFLSEEAIKITKTSVNLSNLQSFSKQSYSENYKHRTLIINNEQSDNSDNVCRYCRVSKHMLEDCKKFKRSMRRERWSYVKKYGICFKCLKPQHKQDNCPAPMCDVDNCGLSHHRMLHFFTNKDSVLPQKSVNVTDATEIDPEPRVETVNHIKVNSCKVLLKTVPIYLHGPNGTLKCVALLDDGSTVTLISAALVSKLGLRGEKQTLRVCGAWNSSEVVCHSEVLDLNLSNCDGTNFTIRARSVENLNLPVQNVDLSDNEVIKPDIKSVICDGQCKPEILIGQDNYDLLLPLEIIKGKPTDPYLTRTPLGWCVHGRARSGRGAGDAMQLQSTLYLSEKEDSESEIILREMQDEMRRSFSIESMGISSKPRQNVLDVQANDQLQQTATLKDGRWYVGLPWKGTFGEMPNSYDNALSRLKGVERKMKSNQSFSLRYKDRIDHLFGNDYASELTETVSPNIIWYLPHFGVDNPNKQKLRLVFDAAARNKGLCLNDYLLKGPDLLISLYGIMLRFRENKVAVTADIKDMFLRIKIRIEDRDALRFLWRESPTEPVKTYVMTSLIFGANCSPFISQFVKNKNAERFESSMPAAVRAVCTQHYMDDYIDSIEDEKTATQLVNDVTYIHKQGGFELRNWNSNTQSVLHDLPTENLKSTPVTFKTGQEYEGERTLGIIWFPTDDNLGFDVSFKRIPEPILAAQKKPTKREMLRVLMSIFDVYGFLSPITIKGKIMLQDTWRSGISWDDEITDQIFTKWIEWLTIMKSISQIRLPRHYEAATRNKYGTNEETVSETHNVSTSALNSAARSPAQRYTNLQLHVFCDASTQAMCAVAYWRWIDFDKNIQVAFVSSKCRVAPVKYVSMPRLELQAAVMAGRLANSIINEHRMKPERKVFWCDSSTAYVAHRLGELDELTEINEWRYISTKTNIADVATRESCDIKTLENEWLYGPPFLYNEEQSWPRETQIQPPEVRNEDLECVNTIHVTPVNLPAVPAPERFSSWLRLVRSMHAVLSFIDKCKKAQNGGADGATMERAETLLLKYSQMKAFPDDLHNLKQNKRLDRNSKLLTLSPILGDDGLLRMAGRIDAATEIPTYVKHPVILDGRCHITHLIVKYYHVKAYHGNQETVVNELKQRYWIIRLRPTVKFISSKCMLCRIKRAQPHPPRMGDLPEARLAHHQRPFTYTGVDLFGPLEVTVGRRREKRYGVIFTCLTVRAIHIELVSQLTTDALIMALRRMAARRGWPRCLYSDNGTNLRGAHTELKKCILELDEKLLKEGATSYGLETTWTFIPPASPHWGGAWERLIRSIKAALKVTLKERAPRDETLQTLMAEIEQTINSRPLSHVSVEPSSRETLTPNHFLLGTSSNAPTLGVFNETDTYLRKQWRISQSLADIFWKRWVREVLPDMRPRQKWHEDQKPLQVGDVVLIVDPNSPRNVWPKGLVQAVHSGKDGRIRVVDVMTKTGLLQRNATRVARIAMGDECCGSTRGGNVGDA
ncbi:hypothetical protein ABMA28_014300 [Loxostege sticticalis]|uniref:Integrase catalytic domain-containing protein n=1 Tax=Loxostege sticticalis TaxID=481309 RepID=A0ABD0TGC8_LOXSC